MILTGNNFGAEVVDWGCRRHLGPPFPGSALGVTGPLGIWWRLRPRPHTPGKAQHKLPNLVGFRGLRTHPRAPRPSMA